MELHQIKYCLAVCRARNFTQAAGNCNVSQPALSRAVQQLEAELGGLLFHRERGNIRETDLCALLKPQFEKILAGIGSTKRDARKMLTLDQGHLRVGVMCSIGPTRFTEILSAFHRHNPAITVQIIEGMPEILLNHLQTGEIEVALVAQPQPFTADFLWHPLYHERFMVAFPLSHNHATKAAVLFDDIDGENYLRRTNCEYDAHLGQICASKGVTLREVYASNREDWIQNFVAAGFGVTFIPEFSAVVPGISARPTFPVVTRQICVVRHETTLLSPSGQLFFDCLSTSSFHEGNAE